MDIAVDDLEGCPRYIGRLFRDVTIGPSPVWLKSRLNAAGMRPISNVVDATNYVDARAREPAARIRPEHARRRQDHRAPRAAEASRSGRSTASIAASSESDLVIADAERAVAIAGIMGGEETEIGDGTTDVLLEAANFEPTGLYRTSERLRLRTEGSNRWEKGVDPHLAEQAAKLATELIVSTAGAEWVGHVDVKGELPERPVISFRPERADELIGLETPPAEQTRWLERLGFDSRDGDVVVPTFRARDVTREVDVVEEVARFRLEEVPFTLPARREMFGALTPVQQPAASRRGRSRRPRARRDVHAVAARRRPGSAGLDAPRARLRRARRPAHAPAAEPRRGRAPEQRAGRRRRRAVRGRPRLPARHRPPRRAHARGRDRRGRLVARQGNRRGALRGGEGRAGVRADDR